MMKKENKLTLKKNRLIKVFKWTFLTNTMVIKTEKSEVYMKKLLSSVRQIKCIYNSIKITKKHF